MPDSMRNDALQHDTSLNHPETVLVITLGSRLREMRLNEQPQYVRAGAVAQGAMPRNAYRYGTPTSPPRPSTV